MPSVNRFIRVGQNTPLTCVYSTGFEYNDSARDKGASASLYATTTTDPHQKSGSGGARALALSSGGNFVSLGFPTLQEYVMCAAMYPDSGAASIVMDASESSGSIQLRCFLSCSTGAVQLLRSTGTNLGTSAGGAVSTNQWNWVHIWGRIDNSAGFGSVRVGSYANEVLAVTGVDTQQHASNNYTNQLRFQVAGNGNKADDVHVYARSMYYSGGSGGAGVPVAGNTLTDGSATAVITHVFDNGAGSGCVFVRTVSGSFAASASINDGSGWTATAGNALANDEASLWVRELYLFLATTDADVLTGFTSSTGAAHYTEVDDAAGTADFVSTNTANQTDEFGTSVTLPPGASIEVVGVSAYARLNGVSAVNNIRTGIDDGAGDMDADADSALSGSWEVHDTLFTRNPNTGAQFTTTEIANMNIRVTSKT